MEKASREQTIFNSKPLGMTAWILPENKRLNSPKTVSMYWRVGFAKTPCMSSVAAWSSSFFGI